MASNNINKCSLGQRINKARKEAGYTADKLSEECEISAIYFRQLESGKYTPSLSTMVKICNKLHISLDYFLKDSLEWNEVTTLLDIADKSKKLSPEQRRSVDAIIDALLTNKL